MKRNQRFSLFIHWLLLVMLVVNSLLPASLLAQEVTPEAPPVETTPDVTPTETTPDVVPTEVTPTDTAPTETPVTIPPTAGSLFTTDFSAGDLSPFLIVGEWAVVGADTVFSTASPNASAVINGMLWDDVILVTTVSIAPNGEAVIGLRMGTESYAVRISDSGNATLWRGDVLLGGVVLPPAETTPDPLAPAQAFAVAISATDGDITVAVDNVTQISITDPVPLSAGYIAFGTSATSAGVVGYDNIFVQAQVPVSSETPVAPVEATNTPIVIPPLEPTPETETPVAEVTEPVAEVTEPVAEVTQEAEATPEAEITPEAEVTPEAEITPEAEATPELEATPVPLSLDEAEIAKLQGNIWGLLEAYYGGDADAAREFAESRYIRWLDDDRLQVWVYPNSPENVPAIAAYLLEIGGEVLFVEAEHVDVIVELDMIVELARDGRIAAITLPVFATPTSAELPAQGKIGTPKLSATTGTGSVIPWSLDQIGVSSWHEADILGNGVNIAVIDTGFNGITNTGERACVGSTNVVGGVGTGSHGVNVIEVLCDVAPQARVYPYSANSVSSVASAIDSARAGGANGFPAAHVILITLDPGGTSTTLDTALANAFNNNVPVIVSAGNGGGAKNSVTFGFSAGSPTTKISVNARSGDTITMNQSVAGNATTIAQVGGGYSDSNAGAGTDQHQYVVGSECGDICQLQITITRTNADPTYVVSSDWTQAVIVPDNTVTIDGGASQLLPYSESLDVLAVGSVCATQEGRFPLTSSSPQGSSAQANTPRMKPDIVAPSHINTSLLTGASIGSFPDYSCSGGFGGSSAAAAHVAGMVALLISNPNMYGINNVSSGRPWQVFSYLKSRALDVNANGYDRGYGAGVAQLGNPNYNLFFERTIAFNADRAGLTISNTLYVSSDRLSNFNILNNTTSPTLPTPDGTIGNPFTHITHALEVARTNASISNIVLLPGEYLTSFAVTKNNLNIFGYDYADSGDHPPTSVWVNDIATRSGLNIINYNTVTIAGLEFVGSNPDFAFNSPPEIRVRPIVPMYIENSSGISIENNTFTNFDQPIEIVTSNSITFTGNTFSNFVVDGDLVYGGSAVLWIKDSGGTTQDSTTTVNVFRNVFSNNSVTLSGAGARVFNSIVLSQRSSSRMYGNRFTNNTVPSVIAIDMWEDYPNRIDPPVKIGGRNIVFSNVIANNTLSGPVVHLMQGNRFQFFNNTVANNTLSNNSWLSIIGLGGRDEAGGNVFNDITDHLWDVSNNLFFANRRASDNNGGVLNLISEQGGLNLNFSCDSVISGTHNGARFNWFIGTNSGYGGDCSSVTGTPSVPANGNVFTNIDTLVADNILAAAEIDAFYTVNFFTTVNDPDHPYRLRPDATTDGSTYAVDPNPALTMDGLIVTGSASTTTLTSKNPGTDARALDALGNPRFVDQTDLSFDVIDYGAYELTEPDPVEFYDNTGGAYSAYSAGNFTFTMNEDGVAFIDMTRMVRKGFRPYSVEVVGNVSVYDTNPLNSCNGQPFLFDPVSNLLAYCPPANFHNVGVTAPITFQYRVTGLFGTGTIPSPTTYATVTVVVNPVDDGTVTTGTQKTATDFTTTINVPLRPRYTLDAGANFFNLPTASGVDNLDYPFTYSMFTETSDPNNLLDGPNLPSMVSSDGVFTYTPPPGAVQGEFSFTYRATDQDGDFATRTMTVRVVDKILTSGLHDNTALGITYTGTWTPVFNDVAYQKSLHSTTQNGAQARFNFTGDNFAISYIGNGVNNGAITIQLDSDGEGFGTATYTNIYSIAGLTCTSVTPAAGNPIQTAVNGRIIIRCTGIESLAGAAGEVHSVRITTGNTNAFRLDWVQVDAQPLTIGMYEDSDLRPYLFSTTFTNTAQSLNGSYEVFGSASSQISFTVDPTVKRIVLFRPIDNVSDHFKVQLSGGTSCTPRTVVVDNFVIAFSVWDQPYTVDLGGCLNVVISRNNSSSTAPGLDRIQLLGTEQRLGVGTYHSKDLYEYFRGRNGVMPQARALGGLAQRLLSTTGDSFMFDVTTDVKTVILYRDNFAARDPIRVRTQFCTNPAHAQDYNVNSTGPDSGPFEPFIVNLQSCTRVRFDRVPIQAAPAFDRIILTSQVSGGGLGLGMYDNTQIKNYFNSSAVLTPNVNAMNGSYHVLPGGANLTFSVTAGVQRMMIYRPINGVAADLRVDLSGSCTPISKIINSFVVAIPVWGQGHIVDLGGCTNVTIVRDTTSGRTGTIGIEAIELLGAEPVLVAGEYHTKDLQQYFRGRNGVMPQTRAVDGVAQRLLSTTGDAFTFNVPQSVDTVVLYRDNYSVRDPIQVVTSDCTIGGDAKNYQVTNNGADAGAFEPTVITLATCTRLSITRVPIQAAPAFDRMILIEGLPTNLPIGEYDNLALGSKFTNSTALGNAAASSGSWHRFNAGGQLSFTVDTSVKRLVVFRPIDNVRDDLRVTLSGGVGCSPKVVVVETFVIAFFMWNQPYTIDLENCVNVVIQANGTAGKTASIGVDRIQLLGTEQPLGLGTYHTVDLYEYFRGRNAEFVDSRAQNGIAQRILSVTGDPFSFNVAAGVSRVVLYRHNYSARDPIRVVTSVGGSCIPQDYNVSNIGTESDFGFPIVVNLQGCSNIAFYRVPIAAAPVIERIELLPAPQPTLTSGNLYQEYHPGLVYTGAWQGSESNLAFGQSVPSHRLISTSAFNASVSFNMTGNGFIIYHRAFTGTSNNVEVCVTTGSNPAVCTNYSTQSATLIPSFPVGIYGLGSGTHTVTITNKHSGGNLVIDAIRIP